MWPSYCQWTIRRGKCVQLTHDFLKRKLFALHFSLLCSMDWNVDVMVSQLWPCRWGQALRGRQSHKMERPESLENIVEQCLLLTLGCPPTSWLSCERERNYLVWTTILGGLFFESSLAWILTSKGHSYIQWREKSIFFPCGSIPSSFWTKMGMIG